MCICQSVNPPRARVASPINSTWWVTEASPLPTHSRKARDRYLDEAGKGYTGLQQGETSMPKIRILIVDDHAILRTGLRMLINTQSDMEVSGEAANAPEALYKSRAMNPDVVLMDITMPETRGIKIVTQVLQECPHTRVLVLTMHEDPAYIRWVLAAGGSGYLMKRAAVSDLLTAIRVVFQGQTFVDPTLGSSLLHDLFGKKATRRPADAGVSMHLLSLRESEVLGLLAQGYTHQRIGKQLFVSIKSVTTYRSRIAQKLGLRSRRDIICYALESGLLTPNAHSSKSNNMPLK
jgi:two-component system, NarL family, response regulator NreC